MGVHVFDVGDIRFERKEDGKVVISRASRYDFGTPSLRPNYLSSVEAASDIRVELTLEQAAHAFAAMSERGNNHASFIAARSFMRGETP